MARNQWGLWSVNIGRNARALLFCCISISFFVQEQFVVLIYVCTLNLGCVAVRVTKMVCVIFLSTALEAFSQKGQFPFYLPSYLPASFVQVGLSGEGNSCCAPWRFGGWKDASCS